VGRDRPHRRRPRSPAFPTTSAIAIAAPCDEQRLEPQARIRGDRFRLYIKGAASPWGAMRPSSVAPWNFCATPDPGLLGRRYMHPDLMDELALDPGRTTSDHPVEQAA